MVYDRIYQWTVKTSVVLDSEDQIDKNIDTVCTAGIQTVGDYATFPWSEKTHHRFNSMDRSMIITVLGLHGRTDNVFSTLPIELIYLIFSYFMNKPTELRTYIHSLGPEYIRFGTKHSSPVIRYGSECMNMRLHIILGKNHLIPEDLIILKYVKLIVGGSDIHTLYNLTGRINKNEIVVPLFFNKPCEYPLIINRLEYHETRIDVELAQHDQSPDIDRMFISMEYTAPTQRPWNYDIMARKTCRVPYFINSNQYINLDYYHGLMISGKNISYDSNGYLMTG